MIVKIFAPRNFYTGNSDSFFFGFLCIELPPLPSSGSGDPEMEDYSISPLPSTNLRASTDAVACRSVQDFPILISYQQQQSGLITVISCLAAGWKLQTCLWTISPIDPISVVPHFNEVWQQLGPGM